MKKTIMAGGLALIGLACLCGCTNMGGVASSGVSPVASVTPKPGGAVAAVAVSQSPKLDKLLDDAIWQQAPILKLVPLSGKVTNAPPTTARIMFDQKFLYVLFDCADPETGGLKTNGKLRDSDVWDDDCVEVFVSPDPACGYKHIIINSGSVVYDESCTVSNRDISWNANLWSVAAIDANKRWRVAMAIPLQDLGVCPGDNQTWRFNLNRTRPERGGLPLLEYSWADLPSHKFQNPKAFVELTGINITTAP